MEFVGNVVAVCVLVCRLGGHHWEEMATYKVLPRQLLRDELLHVFRQPIESLTTFNSGSDAKQVVEDSRRPAIHSVTPVFSLYGVPKDEILPQKVAMSLVGACLATGDRIFATGSNRIVSQKLFCDPMAVLLNCRVCKSWFERIPEAQKYCSNRSFAILSFTFIFFC